MFSVYPTVIQDIIFTYIGIIYFDIEEHNQNFILELYKHKLQIEPYPTYIQSIPSVFYPYIKTIWLQKILSNDIITKYFPNMKTIDKLYNDGEQNIYYIYPQYKKQTNIVKINIDKYYDIKYTENKTYFINKYYEEENKEHLDKIYNYIYLDDSKYIEKNKFNFIKEFNNISNKYLELKEYGTKTFEIQKNLLKYMISKLRENTYCIKFTSKSKNIYYIIDILKYIPNTITTIYINFDIKINDLKIFIDNILDTSIKHLYFINNKTINYDIKNNIKIKTNKCPSNKELLNCSKLKKLLIYNFDKYIGYTNYSSSIFSKKYKIYDKYLPSSINKLCLGTNKNIYFDIQLSKHQNLKCLDISDIWNKKIINLELPPFLTSLYINNMFINYIDKEIKNPDTLEELYIKYNDYTYHTYILPFRKKFKYIKLIYTNINIPQYLYSKIYINYIDAIIIYENIPYTNIYIEL